MAQRAVFAVGNGQDRSHVEDTLSNCLVAMVRKPVRALGTRTLRITLWSRDRSLKDAREGIGDGEDRRLRCCTTSI